MVMKAKVKQNATPNTVTACGGLEFTKKNFRIVPAHEEASAQSNPDLQISVVDDKGKKVVEEVRAGVEEVLARVEEVGTGDTPPEGYYETLTKKQLMAAAADLKLPKGGNKTNLLERLSGYWAVLRGRNVLVTEEDFTVEDAELEGPLPVIEGN